MTTRKPEKCHTQGLEFEGDELKIIEVNGKQRIVMGAFTTLSVEDFVELVQKEWNTPAPDADVQGALDWLSDCHNQLNSEKKLRDYLKSDFFKHYKTLRTELERAQRMRKTLMQISNYPYVEGVCGKNIRIMAKQALDDAPTIKPQYGGWLPIESAPRDGSKFDVWSVRNDGKREVRNTDVYWHKKAGKFMNCYHPSYTTTHWMPLPDAPKVDK